MGRLWVLPRGVSPVWGPLWVVPYGVPLFWVHVNVSPEKGDLEGTPGESPMYGVTCSEPLGRSPEIFPAGSPVECPVCVVPWSVPL
jgi:hypothetical protein